MKRRIWPPGARALAPAPFLTAAIVGIFLAAPPARAEDLIDVIAAALNEDPAFAAAGHALVDKATMSEPVVAALVDLGQSDDAAVRHMAWKQLDEQRHAELVPLMLADFAPSNPVAVRRAAALALAGYVGDAAVRSLFESAQSDDSVSEIVRGALRTTAAPEQR